MPNPEVYEPVALYFDRSYGVFYYLRGRIRRYRTYEDIGHNVARRLSISESYPVLNADELARFIDWTLREGITNTSIFMAMPTPPETVAWSEPYTSRTYRMLPESPIVRYAKEVGRLVNWGGEIYYYCISKEGGVDPIWLYYKETQLPYLLDTPIVRVQEPLEPPSLTPEGEQWGLTHTSTPYAYHFFGTPSSNVSVVLGSAVSGEAIAWFKNFNPAIPHSGFVQLWYENYIPYASEVKAVLTHGIPPPVPPENR